MKHRILNLLVALISINLCAQSPDAELVVESFETYKNAILNDKGELAADHVDSRTMQYYTSILEKIRTADSSVVKALGIIDKITLLSVRHRAPKEELLTFDGRGLFVFAIEAGMVGKNSVMKNTLGDVTINGEFAKAVFLSSGRETPFYFHFYKEDSKWKIDLTSLFPMGATALNKIIEDSGEDENDFILYLLEMVSGTEPEPSIWHPIVDKKG